MVIVGLVFILSTPSGTEHTLLVRNILILERAIRIMQCGMLLLLYLFSHHVGITWRNQLFGVILGFGVYASLNLVMYSLRSRFGEDWNTSAAILNSVSYLLTTGIWGGIYAGARGGTHAGAQRGSADPGALEHGASGDQGPAPGAGGIPAWTGRSCEPRDDSRRRPRLINSLLKRAAQIARLFYFNYAR
jgi:hypothetical protein